MFEIDFLPVGAGNGDAICLRYGNDQNGHFVHVVDGGFADTADTIIRHIETHYGKGWYINHMVLSHADNDHATGLVGVLKHLTVKHLWMNRPWLYAAEILPHFHGNYQLSGLVAEIRQRHAYLVELESLAAKQGTIVHEVFQGARIGEFVVLAPSRQRYISLLPDLEKTPTSYREAELAGSLGNLFRSLVEKAKTWLDETWDYETLSNSPPPTSASNETCVVQHAVIDGHAMLLTADAGPQALTEAADFAQALGFLVPPRFVQVPHHGSRRNVTPAVLDRWLGAKMAIGQKYGVAFCSVGSEKADYPRGQVKNAFQRRGYPVHVTRGIPKRHYLGYAERGGTWSPSVPEQFDSRVEG